MFCPKCGSTQSDDLKFCKSCGANLLAVRNAITTSDAGEKFDWSKTWVAEMLMSGEEAVRRAAEIERLQGITPETKRRNEIKAGVITGCVGVGVTITLFVLMQGIILGGGVSEAAAQILSRVWVAGIIPVMVGIALVVNGMVVSKRSKEIDAHETGAGNKDLNAAAGNEYLPPAETNQLRAGVPFSITDETTQHLEEPVDIKARARNAD
jgi:hypothetical protein